MGVCLERRIRAEKSEYLVKIAQSLSLLYRLDHWRLEQQGRVRHNKGMTSTASIKHGQRIALLLLAIAVSLGIGYWLGNRPTRSEPDAYGTGPGKVAGESISTRIQDGLVQIVVPSSMARSGALASMMIERKPWLEERVVPARLELDPARHYAVTAPAEVVVDELLVPLGSRVERGEPLLEMSTSQITTLRGGLLRQQLLTEKAVRAVEWNKEIKTRIDAIVSKVQGGMDLVPEQWIVLDTEQTADYGAKIVSAYAKYWAASQLSKISQRASNSGVVAERSIVERMTELESAKAVLQGAIEQSRFEVRQAILAAESDLAAAEGALQSIQSDLRRYLGMRTWDSSKAMELPHPNNPDRFVHRSPGAGIVLERYFANGERASTGELIVLVADTTHLWLIGELRQQDWDLLHMNPGDKVEAEVVGLESLGRLPAVIEMLGGVVQTNSGSIRLTASLNNEKLLLRPGMIARLIMSSPVEGLRVPSTALFSNDGLDYLLRQDEESTFSLIPVRVGSRKQGYVEILEGLNDRDRVLVSGVFPIASQAFLKEDE
jgi:multidrug efflux pump subunit AcrA (membrane-fusion protein)